MKITTYIKSLFSQKPVSPKKKLGVFFENVNIRNLKGEELNNIKITIKNYVGDGILSQLISSKANQIKDESMAKCHDIIENGFSSEEAINKAGLIMLGASFKIKGLEELRQEIQFFARKDSGSSQPSTNPHEHV